MEGDRNEDKVENMTTRESGEGGHGVEDWDLTEKRGDVEKWRKTGKRLSRGS